MMRALWTAGSGMIAQQFNVDVISNNLANVNTTGYKKQRAEFKDLLYSTLDRAYTLDEKGKPVNLQVGHGTEVVATVRNNESGNLEKTGNTLDFAIEGEGYFAVQGPKGDKVYTRDGSFKISITDGGRMLTTSDGYPVLDDSEQTISMDTGAETLSVSPEGDLSYTDQDGQTQSLGQKIGIYKFMNRDALENLGDNFYASNSASGDAIPDEEEGVRSIIKQGCLETSNVQVVEEMVKLIVAQRAYEINSKSIQTADEMLSLANNLKK